MHIIDSAAAALDQPLDPALKRVLTLRIDQLGSDMEDAARFLVVEPPDGLRDVEVAVGFPLTINDAPTWEWAEHHEGGWLEIVFILSDDGPADVLLVPNRTTIDPTLADLLHRHIPAHHQAASTTTA